MKQLLIIFVIFFGLHANAQTTKTISTTLTDWHVASIEIDSKLFKVKLKIEQYDQSGDLYNVVDTGWLDVFDDEMTPLLPTDHHAQVLALTQSLRQLAPAFGKYAGVVPKDY
jgi:hypothetical protein